MRSLVIALVTLGTACSVLMPNADRPTTGVARTGEPLGVVDGMKTWLQRDKVGDIRVEDDAGQRIARADVYGTRMHAKAVWLPVQGDNAIADEDFFRIAGDKQSYEATLAYRERNEHWNRVGKYTFIGGWVATFASVLFDGRTAQAALTIGGATAVFTGWYIMKWSHDEQQADSHAVDRWDAIRAADKYNRTHGFSVSRKF